MQEVPKYHYNEKTKEMVPLNDAARKVVEGYYRTREQVLADTGMSESEELNEEIEMMPGWVKVPVGTAKQESMKQSYIAMGLSVAEANIAAGIESSPHEQGSQQSIKESYLALGMSEAEASIAAGIDNGPNDEGDKLRRAVMSQS
jgi:hypothetical protein